MGTAVRALVIVTTSGCGLSGGARTNSQLQTSSTPASSESAINLSAEIASALAYTPPAVPSNAVPSGYKSAGSGVYFKFSAKGTVDCSYYDSRVGIDVYSEDGCDTLYIEAAVEKNGVVVDNSNKRLSGIEAGGKAQAVLGQLGNGTGLKFRLTELNCY